MGADFSDEHPDLVAEVIAQSEAIERSGLRVYAEEHDMSLSACFETLLTGDLNENRAFWGVFGLAWLVVQHGVPGPEPSPTDPK